MKPRGMWAAQLVSAGIVAASWLLSAAFYSSLPDPIVTHWNIHGEADGFMPKPWGAFLMPIVITAMWGLTLAAWWGRRRLGIEPFARTFGILQCAILGFLFALGAGASFAPSSHLRMKYLMAAMGGLFVVLGNYMGKVTQNPLVGVRTPWTHANPEVWLRSNRFGGRVLVVLGLGVAAMGFAGLDLGWMLAAVFLASALVVAYSYLSYRGLARRG